MPKSGQQAAAPADAPVPMERVARFVHMLVHDVRNDLNVIDLQASYTAHIAKDSETAEGLKKIRTSITEANHTLQRMTSRFNPLRPNLVPLAAAIFEADFREYLAQVYPRETAEVRWAQNDEMAEIAVDLTLLRNALMEIFRNAFELREKGPITVQSGVTKGRWTLEIREPKTTVTAPPEGWGRTPFESTRRGGYGLGLYQLRRVLAAHGGEVVFLHDPKKAILTTRISLPLLPLFAA